MWNTLLNIAIMCLIVGVPVGAAILLARLIAGSIAGLLPDAQAAARPISGSAAASALTLMLLTIPFAGCTEPPYDGDCYSERQCEELHANDEENDSGCSASRSSSSNSAGAIVAVAAALLLVAARRRRKALLAVCTVALLAIPSLAFAGGASYDNGDSCGGGPSSSSSSADSGCGGPSVGGDQAPRVQSGGCLDDEEQEPAPTLKDRSDARFWRLLAIVLVVVCILLALRNRKKGPTAP